MWPSVKGLILTAGLNLALLTHVAASACTGTQQIPGHEVAPPAQPSTVPSSQHGEGQPRTLFFWESHHKYPGLWVLTECSGISKPREELVSIFLESGAVVTLRARVPGRQGQAVNPAPGGTRSISLHILPPHKCLFNSGLIPNNAAAPLKSPEMKTCETINPRAAPWLAAALERLHRDHVLFQSGALGPCSWCSLEHRASLTSLAALCTPPELLPLHREQFGTVKLTPSEPNESLGMFTATATSFDSLQRCPKGSVLLPRSHDITYRINNCNIFTDMFTIHSQTRMTEFCLKPIPSLSSFPHPQFSHLLIYSLSGREGQRWEEDLGVFFLLNQQNPHY